MKMMQWSFRNPKAYKEKWPKSLNIHLSPRSFTQRSYPSLSETPLKSHCHVRSIRCCPEDEKISASLSEAPFAQRLARFSFAQQKTKETRTKATVSFPFPRCFCVPLSLSKIPNFAQQEHPSLSEASFFCIVSEPNNIVFWSICTKMGPQPRWSCASDTYYLMLQKAHKNTYKNT